MGNGCYSGSAFKSYATNNGYSNANSFSDIYISHDMKDKYNPALISKRESRDSEEHPDSYPIIIGLDVTGSMGDTSLEIAKTQLNKAILKIQEKSLINNPQILFAAIGDSKAYDEAPLQVTQFESDIRIIEQLTDLYFEGDGGGNGGETYGLAWYFANHFVSADRIEKGRGKGLLITIGDEPILPTIENWELSNVFGNREDRNYESIRVSKLYNELSKQWDIFHIRVNRWKCYDNRGIWDELLNDHVYAAESNDKIADIIDSIVTRVTDSQNDVIIDDQTSMLAAMLMM